MVSPAESSASDEDVSSEYASSVDKKPAKRKRGRQPGKRSVPTPKINGHTAPTTTTGQKTGDLWRPGVKVTGEGEVFIPLPKARSAGSTPYQDGTIHPNTLLFLADLAKNNDRDWLKTNDADYRASLRDWNSFVDALTPLIVEKDETIPELPNKDLTFRIYRDIRFSPDPTPYKTHFSAAWSRTGRKGPYAGYYVQIQPKASFVGAGVWHPEAAPLSLLRKAVDRHGDRLKGVLMGDDLRKTYLGGVKKDEKECVKKFVALNQESALKTKPRVSLLYSTVCNGMKGDMLNWMQDYAADHPEIALLRLRNYTIGKKLKDEEVLGEGGMKKVVDLISVLEPFVCLVMHSHLNQFFRSLTLGSQVTYLNSVVMPDTDPSSDEDDEASEGEPNGAVTSGSEEDEDDVDNESDDEPN